MAIVVKHGAGTAAPIAAAAFGGAQGHVRQVAQRQMAAQTGRREDAELANRRKVDAAALGHTRGLERMDLNSQLQQRAAEGAQSRRRDDLEFGLTTRQNAEMNRLAEAEAQALSNPDFTADEKAELRRRFDAKRAGIQPVSRPRQQTPAEIFKARTHVDPRTGAIYPIDEKGQIGKPFPIDPRQPTVADRIKAVQAATQLATDPETNIQDPDKFKAAMAQMLGSAQGEQGAGAPAMGMQPPAMGMQPPATGAAQMDDLNSWSVGGDTQLAPQPEAGDGRLVRRRGWGGDPPASEIQAQIQDISGGSTVQHPLHPREIENLPTARFQLRMVEEEIESMKQGLVRLGGRDAEHRAERFDPNTGKSLEPRKKKRSGSPLGRPGGPTPRANAIRVTNRRILESVEPLKARAEKIKGRIKALEGALEERRGVQLMLNLKRGS